jgi:glycosyltransferase involved in cell wall biosynthesis
VLVCSSLDAGGIERVVSTLANAWSRRGRRVSVVTLHDRNRFFTLDPAVHHVIVKEEGRNLLGRLFVRIKGHLSSTKLARSGFAERLYIAVFIAPRARAMRRVLRRVESPVVVAFGTSVNIITLRACEGLGRRVVISERNDPRRLARLGLWELIWRKHYRHADVVTANTRSALTEMGAYVEPEKLAFVPNPLVMQSRLSDALAEHAPSFLSVGRLVFDKAHDVLLDAFALLGDDLAEWRLAVVGDGRMREVLEAQAAELGVASRVRWHGQQDPHPFYCAARIFVMPSRVEGTSNALLEAMSYGLPVIVSDGAPGLLELVEDGVTGLVVPVNDAPALAAALQRLATDAALRERLGQAAKARVSEFDLPRALAEWESVVGLAR